MAYDLSKLKGKIIECYGSQDKFASAAGVSPQTISAKLRGTTKFGMDEIIKISEMLGIGQEEIGVYFFTPKV